MNRSLLNELEPHNLGALLVRLLAIADDAVIVADAQLRVVVFNEGAERIFGYASAQVLGKPIEMLLPLPLQSGHAQHMREFARSGPASRRMGERRAIHGRRMDGRLFDAEASIANLELDGQTFFAAILRDVSEAREAQRVLQRAKSEAEAAARAKSLFLANMSHEIRTPLNAVIGMSLLLMETPLSEDQRDIAQTIRTSGQTLLETVNDILDFSKTDVEKLELEQRPFDLRHCVESSLDLVAPRAFEKNLDLAYSIEEGTPETLIGDATRVRQILVNLLSNAVKFTHHGEVVLSVGSQVLDESTRRIHIAVKDTGIGIAAEHLPRLFQSFTQVDPSTTRKYGGTGLGLAICKRLSKLMGGDVRVESQAGRGSVFHATLTATLGPDTAAEFLQRNVPELAGKHALIVDASAHHRRLLAQWAERWGMTAQALESASQALECLAGQSHFDLALLDMNLMGVDAFLTAALQPRPGAAPLPIVGLTTPGRRMAQSPEPGVAPAVWLNKPIKVDALFTTLKAVLGGHAVPAPAALPRATVRHMPKTLALRVLVAEDNSINQKVVVRMLQRLGYSCDLAANGLEALEAVTNRQYDVVLMDIHMPELDGVQAARRIVERRGAAGIPRVIAMTANAMPGDREAFLAAGMDGYLGKPIDMDELAAVLLSAGRHVTGAPAAPADLEPILDPKRLAQLRALQDASQPELLRELIGMFVADVPRHLESLGHAHAAGDDALLRSVAHRFLSITDNIGARRMSAVCGAIERAARTRSTAGVASLIEELRAEHQRVNAAFSAQRLWP